MPPGGTVQYGGGIKCEKKDNSAVAMAHEIVFFSGKMEEHPAGCYITERRNESENDTRPACISLRQPGKPGVETKDICIQGRIIAETGMLIKTGGTMDGHCIAPTGKTVYVHFISIRKKTDDHSGCQGCEKNQIRISGKTLGFDKRSILFAVIIQDTNQQQPVQEGGSTKDRPCRAGSR